MPIWLPSLLIAPTAKMVLLACAAASVAATPLVIPGPVHSDPLRFRPDAINPLTPVYALPFHEPIACTVTSFLSAMSSFPPLPLLMLSVPVSCITPPKTRSEFGPVVSVPEVGHAPHVV